MPLLQLLILALVQGLTEFLPVSSSAHLVLVPLAVPSWSDQGPLIDVAVHVGSLGAVMIYFRLEVMRIIRGGLDTWRRRESENRQLFLFIVLATIPIVVIAPIVYLAGIVDMLRNPAIIGLASIGFGILLWIADRCPQATTSVENFTWKTVACIGLAQALAIIPGTSRSGITITIARFFAISRTEAARFSMLLSIPTISAFGLFAAFDLAKGGGLTNAEDAILAAILSFVAAYGAIFVFMRMLGWISFTPFVIYRCALGILLLTITAL